METSKATEGGNNNEKLLVVDDVGAEGEATTAIANAISCSTETSKTTEGGSNNENLVVVDDIGAEGEDTTANATSCSTETNKTTEGGNSNENLVVVGDVGAEDEATTANPTSNATATESETKKNKKKKKKKKKNHIQVSNSKKPLVFYLNLAKRFIKQYTDVKLSGLGMAIPTAVIISETLKRKGLAIEKKIAISSVGSKDDVTGRIVQKAQIEIVLAKAEKLDKITVATSPKNAAD